MSIADFFGRSPKKYFLDFTPEGSHWRVVTWNFDLESSESRRLTIEVHAKTEKIIEWEKKDREEVRFFENQKIERKKVIVSPEDELRTLMNLALHSTLKFGLESNHEFMVTPVSGATIADIQTETRALQWIQATFMTLTRALENFKKRPELILTAACFSGRVPESNEDVLRVIAFNLDIFFYLRPDYSLQIVIFDDKNQGHGNSKTPTFQQIIKVTKPQFYDEITKLLHFIAQVGEIV